MEKFTATETDRINVLYADGFKGEITADDIALISRFEYMKAYSAIEYEMKEKETQEKMRTMIDNAQTITDKALNALNDLHTFALSRMAALEKRERPTIEQAQKEELKPQNMTRTVRDGK